METTKVKVRSTLVKYFDAEANEAKQMKLEGKVSMGDAKKEVKAISKDNVLLSKENEHEEFFVSTSELVKIRLPDEVEQAEESAE